MGGVLRHGSILRAPLTPAYSKALRASCWSWDPRVSQALCQASMQFLGGRVDPLVGWGGGGPWKGGAPALASPACEAFLSVVNAFLLVIPSTHPHPPSRTHLIILPEFAHPQPAPTPTPMPTPTPLQATSGVPQRAGMGAPVQCPWPLGACARCSGDWLRQRDGPGSACSFGTGVGPSRRRPHRLLHLRPRVPGGWVGGGLEWDCWLGVVGMGCWGVDWRDERASAISTTSIHLQH